MGDSLREALDSAMVEPDPVETVPLTAEALQRDDPESYRGQAEPVESPDHQNEQSPAAALDDVRKGLRRLSAKVHALELGEGRLAAIDEVLASFGRGQKALAHDLTATLKAPGGLVTRVELLEEATVPGDLHLPAGLVEQLERLVSQVASFESLCKRVDTLEKAMAGEKLVDPAEPADSFGQESQILDQLSLRTEALSRGLSSAMDMIGRLSQQMTSLEEAITSPGRPARPIER